VLRVSTCLLKKLDDDDDDIDVDVDVDVDGVYERRPKHILYVRILKSLYDKLNC